MAALTPDVAVLQECARPPVQDAATAWFGSNPRQGIAILSRAPYQVFPEPVRPGSRSMYAVRVRGPYAFTVVAIWAQLEPSYAEGLRRGLAIYRDLLIDGPTVLLGDFNSSVAWDNQHGQTSHRELEMLLRQEFGLVSAYHTATGESPGVESQATHYWRWQERATYHLDYCYLPEAWLPGLQTVTVGSYVDWADASDHRPVTIDVSPPGGHAGF